MKKSILTLVAALVSISMSLGIAPSAHADTAADVVQFLTEKVTPSAQEVSHPAPIQLAGITYNEIEDEYGNLPHALIFTLGPTAAANVQKQAYGSGFNIGSFAAKQQQMCLSGAWSGEYTLKSGISLSNADWKEIMGIRDIDLTPVQNQQLRNAYRIGVLFGQDACGDIRSI
ncbi:MAG: hypothetical protein JWN75_124 [Candidatus Saccharibacteria bacterium]|nr:hypothetical protein [Candidatus Saccharibacteria bacterium]